MMYRVIILTIISFFISFTHSLGQVFWTKIKESDVIMRSGSTREIIPSQYETYKVDLTAIQMYLKNAPVEFSGPGNRSQFTIDMPMADGNIETFIIVEAPVMELGLAAKFPDIKSYKGYSTKSKLTQIRFAVSPRGIHAALNTPKGEVYIDPYATDNTEAHVIYYTKNDLDETYKNVLMCGTQEESDSERRLFRPFSGNRSTANVEMRTYRIAVACTGEWGTKRGTVAACIADINAMITRLNMIYENDLAVRFVLIADNDKLIHLNPTSDPYDTPLIGGQLVGVNTGKLNAIISSSAYDIGHVLSTCTDVGGVAQPSSLCQSNKGNGVTCHRSESISVVVTRIMAHEIGHQFSASHSWNNCPSSADQRAATTAFEPGSGSTIMSYAGSCGTDNVAGDNDDYFHVGSLKQMYYKTQNTGNGYNCAQKINTANVLPVLEVPKTTYTIPVLTPFELKATGTDENGDVLTYTWEQYDIGGITTLGTASETGPLFRSWKPSTTGNIRFFPRASNIFSGTLSDKNEVLPNTTRSMSFMCTVRDNNAAGGGVVWDDYTVKTDANAGPFRMIFPNSDEKFKVGQKVEVQWDVAGTNVAPINCKNVHIYGSFNNELVTGSPNLMPLALNVPNDGSQEIIIPNIPSNFFRIVIKAADNIFLTTGVLPSKIEQTTVPGILMETSVNDITICRPNIGIIDITTSGLAGFAGDIHFTIASALPSGVSAAFDFNKVLTGSTNILKINTVNVTEDLSFPLVIKAESSGIASLERTVQVLIKRNDLNHIVLKTPQNGISGVSSSPQFSWDLKPDASAYELQVATNPGFETSQLVFSKESDQTTIKSEVILNKSTLYYWRVRAINACGSGTWTDIQAFMTEALACKTYNSGVQSINISSSGSPVVEIPVQVTDEGIALDINIKRIIAEHNRLVDLEGYLIAPSGKEVNLWSRKCGTQKNINLGLDDQATDFFQCPINTGKIYQPENPLASLQNEQIKGSWRLQIADKQSGEGGRLQEFNLEICSNLAVSNPFVVKNQILKLYPGNTRIITDTLLLSSDNDNNAAQLTYTLVTLPQQGNIYIHGNKATIGSNFTQADINDAKVVYSDISENEGADFFTFTVNDGQGGWISITRFDIQKSKSIINAVKNIEIRNYIKLHPNPSHQEFTITKSDIASDMNKYEIIGMTGKTVLYGTLTESVTLVNIALIPNGIYFVQLSNGVVKVSKKLVKY